MSGTRIGDENTGGENPSTSSSVERPTEQQLAEARQALAEQHLQERRKLEALESAAEAAEDELVDFEATRGDFELLQHACEAVEKLSEQRISVLFWGEEMAGVPAQAHLRKALAKVDDFYTELKRLEAAYRAAVDAIEGQQGALELVDYDLEQALQEEESRRQEWIVEREPNYFPNRLLAMPWMRGFEEDQRFRKGVRPGRP